MSLCLVMAFFRCRLEDAVAAAQDVLASKNIATEWRDLPPAQSIDAARDQLPPPDGPPSALFFASPECGPWTGLFSRMDDGWYTLVNAMTRHASQLEALFVSSDLKSTPYLSTAFELFRGGSSDRRIHAWKEEDGWHFVSRGVPLSIEDASHYSRRPVAERLNLVILDDMLSKLDINLSALLTGTLTEAKLLTT
jgi:hypothetical protein